MISQCSYFLSLFPSPFLSFLLVFPPTWSINLTASFPFCFLCLYSFTFFPLFLSSSSLSSYLSHAFSSSLISNPSPFPPPPSPPFTSFHLHGPHDQICTCRILISSSPASRSGVLKSVTRSILYHFHRHCLHLDPFPSVCLSVWERERERERERV